MATNKKLKKVIVKDFKQEEYDVINAFRRIEEHLIDKIMASLRSHAPNETAKWRVEELKRLEQYRLDTYKEYTPIFADLNNKIERLIRYKHWQGMSNQEKEIMKAIENGYNAINFKSHKAKPVAELNTAKLEALIKATREDMEKAEYAVLRRANDEYRKIIFDAEVGLNTGSLTYEEAIDMASKDLIANGIQCVIYKNGTHHTLQDYCDMAVRTANKKAYLTGEGQVRQEFGCHFVITINRNGDECEKCAPYVGTIMVDDVYSGGTEEEAKKHGYILLSTAMANGYLHPRCKDSYSTYFPELTKKPKKLTKEQIQEISEKSNKKQKENYANRQAEKYDRLSKNSMSKDNKQKYKARAKEWKDKT